MADPRKIGPQTREANLSPLMQARLKASKGERVNFCPFGCTDDELDDLWYCHHLIGFTNDGVNIELMKTLNNDHKCVQVPLKGRLNGKPVFAYDKVQKTDQLVRITTSARVYRNVPRPPGLEEVELTDDELEAATRPQ